MRYYRRQMWLSCQRPRSWPYLPGKLRNFLGVWNSKDENVSCNFPCNFPVIISFYYGSMTTFIIIPDIIWALSRFSWQLPGIDILIARLSTHHLKKSGRGSLLPWARKSLPVAFDFVGSEFTSSFPETMGHPLAVLLLSCLEEERRKSPGEQILTPQMMPRPISIS